jgi:hypothetical protein
MSEPRRQSKHFLNRESDGTVRLRIRFQAEEASLFEEAAGNTPIMVWLHRTLEEAAREQVRAARANRNPVPPPQ